MKPGSQAPIPDWLKVRIRLKPELFKQFRKFLKLIHKIEKKHNASLHDTTTNASDL